MRSDAPFYLALGRIGGLFVALVAALVLSDVAHTTPDDLRRAFASPPMRAAVWMSLVSFTAAAVPSVWVAVPLGDLLSRTRFPGKFAVELLLDVPLVLPPLVVGLSLLILFQTAPGRWFRSAAAAALLPARAAGLRGNGL